MYIYIGLNFHARCIRCTLTRFDAARKTSGQRNVLYYNLSQCSSCRGGDGRVTIVSITLMVSVASLECVLNILNGSQIICIIYMYTGVLTVNTGHSLSVLIFIDACVIDYCLCIHEESLPYNVSPNHQFHAMSKTREGPAVKSLRALILCMDSRYGQYCVYIRYYGLSGISISGF